MCCELSLLSLIMYSLQLTHPFGLLVSGGTKTEKTTFVKKLLSNVEVMIDRRLRTLNTFIPNIKKPLLK